MNTRVLLIILLLPMLALAAAAPAQDTSKTGSGASAGSLQDIRNQFDRQWNGTPGQLLKGAIGLAGLALALSAADDALNYSVNVDGGGSASASSGSSGGGGGSTDTSTSTSTSTSTTTSTWRPCCCSARAQHRPTTPAPITTVGGADGDASDTVSVFRD